MKGVISLILQEEIFKGNLLDIGMENYGIIYSAYKQLNDEISVDYLAGREGEGCIRHNYYDNCILLFSLNKIFLKKNKLRLIKEIREYLKDKGCLYIWDADKSPNKIWNNTIKIQIQDKSVKEISVRDINIFKDNSKENTLKLLRNYFEVIDFKCWDGVYYIKANKIIREKGIDENCAGSS